MHTHDNETVYEVMEKVEHNFLRSTIGQQFMPEYQAIMQEQEKLDNARKAFWAKVKNHFAVYVNEI